MNSRTGFEFRNVCKSFGTKRVLNNVSFVLPDGQHTALIGASGCGKSTLLRLLAGLDTPDTGEILLDGTVISIAHKILVLPHQRGVSMVFQDLALWPNLSAVENVVLGLGTSLPRAQACQRAVETLRLCGIESLRDRCPGSLSGGEQQRVSLARALAPKPRFILLDEPFAGLDLTTKSQLFQEIASMCANNDSSLLVVTHDLFEAMMLCKRAVVLEEGKQITSGSIDEVVWTAEASLVRLFRERVRHLGERRVDS